MKLKHLKTFESFSNINDEFVDEGFKGFFTGHESEEEKETKKQELLKQIDDYELKSKSDDNLKTWVWKDGKWNADNEFIKSNLIKAAEKNNWKGVIKKSNPLKGISYVGYADGKTPLHAMFSGGGGFMQ